MIIHEITPGGLIHTYSDSGFYIHGGDPEDDYAEAYDPAPGREYIETDRPIDDGEPEPTAEEKAQAWDIITGASDGGEQA